MLTQAEREELAKGYEERKARYIAEEKKALEEMWDMIRIPVPPGQFGTTPFEVFSRADRAVDNMKVGE